MIRKPYVLVTLFALASLLAACGGSSAVVKVSQPVIELSWGSSPEDLDSHLWVPDGSGSHYEVYYDQMGDKDNFPYAELDRDDTDGEGPERIEITRLQNGTYSYAVEWFAGEGSWADSRATVNVYDGDRLVASFNAPADRNEPDASGKEWWYVFDIDGNTGVITVKNLLSTDPPYPSAGSLAAGQTK
ncbi:YfaP family protein [Oceanithermus sp.]